MSIWQNELTILLRNIIDDAVEPFNFNSSRLEQVLVSAAQLVLTEINFEKTYTINVDECEISPDPTQGDKDDGFINLVVLKAGCLVARSEFRTHSLKALSVKDGPTTVQFSDRARYFKDLYNDICEKYDTIKLNYQLGGGRVGHLISTPTTNENIGRTGSSHRQDRDGGLLDGHFS